MKTIRDADATPGLPPPADPPKVRPGKPVPQNIAAMLSIVRILLSYGLHLANTLDNRAAARSFATIAQFFGTARLPAIRARLARGLLRAWAPERVLLARAARGRDLVFYKPRDRVVRAPATAAEPDPNRPRPARHAGPEKFPIPRTRHAWNSSKRKSAAAPSAGRWPISAATSASRPACARETSGST